MIFESKTSSLVLKGDTPLLKAYLPFFITLTEVLELNSGLNGSV